MSLPGYALSASSSIVRPYRFSRDRPAQVTDERLRELAEYIHAKHSTATAATAAAPMATTTTTTAAAAPVGATNQVGASNPAVAAASPVVLGAGSLNASALRKVLRDKAIVLD